MTRARRITLVLAFGVIAGSTALASIGSQHRVHAEESPEPSLDAPAEIVVKLRADADVDDFVAEWDATVADTMVGSRGIYVVEVPFDESEVKPKDVVKKRAEHVKKTSKKMEKSDDVVYAQPNFAVKVSDDRLHFWQVESSEVGDERDRLAYLTQPIVGVLGLLEAHHLSRGEGSTIAIVDTGIDLDHPDLVDRLVAGYDFVDDDEHPDDAADGLDHDGDGHVDEGVGHGTAVAGLAHLVAPDAALMPIRILDSDGNGNVYVLAEAIMTAVRAGATVINLSAGVHDDAKSDILDDAIKFADEHGVVIVAAGGNDGDGRKTYPAAHSKVVAVGGSYTDDPLRLAKFSNHGKWIMVAAPATELVTTDLGGFATATGTSMSAPIVSAALALAHAANPMPPSHKRGDELIHAIEHSSHKLRQGPKIERGSLDIAGVLAEIIDH